LEGFHKRFGTFFFFFFVYFTLLFLLKILNGEGNLLDIVTVGIKAALLQTSYVSHDFSYLQIKIATTILIFIPILRFRRFPHITCVRTINDVTREETMDFVVDPR
jgi:exosome complex RNA-binding protein Rrp42 (RNase PH superfamily)